jgi:hypothetical protein
MIFVGNDKKIQRIQALQHQWRKDDVSKDVEFDEEEAWNWKVDDCEKYDFLSIFYEKEERYTSKTCYTSTMINELNLIFIFFFK